MLFLSGLETARANPTLKTYVLKKYGFGVWNEHMQKVESKKTLATKTLSLKVKTLEPKTAPKPPDGAGTPVIGYS
jgi:hypothetical protein